MGITSGLRISNGPGFMEPEACVIKGPLSKKQWYKFIYKIVRKGTFRVGKVNYYNYPFFF